MMKYRTRSRLLSKGQDDDVNSEAQRVAKGEIKTNLDSDSTPSLKLLVRENIDLESLFKLELIGENDIKFVFNKGEVVETSRSVICLTSSLVDKLVSLMPCCSNTTIFIPDYSASALNILLQLLTTGATLENNLDKQQVTEIKTLAKELEIDLSGIATSNQYYEIIDTSENKESEESIGEKHEKMKQVQQKLSTTLEEESQVTQIASSSFNCISKLDTLDVNLPSCNSPSEVSDELHDDLFDGEEEPTRLTFKSGIYLNSTSNLPKLGSQERLMRNDVGVETEETGDDFEFDEEYPEEEDWDVDMETSRKEGGALPSSDSIKSIKDKQGGGGVTKENLESKEVTVKVNSLHGMIDSFLSSFKDGLAKNNNRTVKVLIGKEPRLQSSSNEALAEEEKFVMDDKVNSAKCKKVETDSSKLNSEEIKSVVDVEKIAVMVSSDSLGDISSATSVGSDVENESNQILVDGKYNCMFCESSYAQVRGLFNHCSSEHFHDEIKVKFGSLINKGTCTLCNKKVRVSRVSHHLGASHRKVNEMLSELSLPCIPYDEPKNANIVDETEEASQEYIPRATRTRSGRKGKKVYTDTEEENDLSSSKFDPMEQTGIVENNESNLKSDEDLLKMDLEEQDVDVKNLATKVVSDGKLVSMELVEKEVLSDDWLLNMDLEEQDVDIETTALKVVCDEKMMDIDLKVKVGNTVSLNSAKEEQEVETRSSALKSDGKVALKNFKLPSRLKISPVEVANEQEKAVKSKVTKNKKRVSFSIGEKELKEKTHDPIPVIAGIPQLTNAEEKKSIIVIKNNKVENPQADVTLFKEKNEKVTPITLKFGKGSSLAKKDIPPITLPPHTTIRFENSEDNKNPEVENETNKKMEIRSNLKKIEAQLKKIDKSLLGDVKKPIENDMQNICSTTVVAAAVENSHENNDKLQNDESGIIVVKPFVLDQTDTKDDFVEGEKEPISTLEKVDVQSTIRQQISVEVNEALSEEVISSKDFKDVVRDDEMAVAERSGRLMENTINQSTVKPTEDVICDKIPSIPSQVELKLKEEVKDNTVVPSPEKIAEPPVNYFNCPLCIYIVDKKITLREHLSIVHYKDILLEMFTEKDSKCNVCKKTYNNENHLSRHIGSNHKKLKEITSVHSKVYSVDNSKSPSLSDTFPCMVCYKCKADTCMKCIACMEMKSNPKVTEAVCFKKRCASPICEEEFEVMKLTSGAASQSNNDADIKLEPDQVDVKIEAEPSLETHPDTQMASFVIKTETMDVCLETLNVINADTIEEDQIKQKQNPSCEEELVNEVLSKHVKEVDETHGNNVVANPTGNVECSEVKTDIEVDDALRSIPVDMKNKKRKVVEEKKVKVNKRSKSVSKEDKTPKKVELPPKAEPVPDSQASNVAPSTTSYSETALSSPTAATKVNKLPAPSKASLSTLSQLRTALKLPSVIKPIQANTREDDEEPNKTEAKSEKKVLTPKAATDISEVVLSLIESTPPALKCFKCLEVFASRSILYEHYSVKHFYRNIINTFKPQDICPIPSCNVAISKENIWVSHVGAKHNIVEGFIPKEHRISAGSAENKPSGNQNSEPKESQKPKLIKSKSLLNDIVSSTPISSSSKPNSTVVSNGKEVPSASAGSYRWWQDLGGDLLKGAEKKGEELVGDKSKVVKSKRKQQNVNKL